MPKYQIVCPVAKANGTQVFSVDCDSVEEAKRLFDSGDERVEFESEEIEVIELGEPEVTECQ